ncbi:hypothetical protein V0M98_33200 (plasmid) [Pseudomonas silesiensis]|uniref:hypothetical protein n=1 Tax=Pseudomonas silesiensis TaxID=1853130 RepID=UPI0030CB5659
MSTFFHVTTKPGMEAILANGLEPRIGERSAQANEPTPAVFAFVDRVSLEDGLSNWLGEAFEDYHGELFILEFTYTGTRFRRDLGCGYEIAILEPVPASQIVRVLDEYLMPVQEFQPAANPAPPASRRVTSDSSTFEL